MTLDDLQARRVRMIDYLKLKVDEADWHGVMDAAADLREIDVEKKFYESLNPLWQQTLRQDPLVSTCAVDSNLAKARLAGVPPPCRHAHVYTQTDGKPWCRDCDRILA